MEVIFGSGLLGFFFFLFFCFVLAVVLRSAKINGALLWVFFGGGIKISGGLLQVAAVVVG